MDARLSYGKWVGNLWGVFRIIDGFSAVLRKGVEEWPNHSGDESGGRGSPKKKNDHGVPKWRI